MTLQEAMATGSAFKRVGMDSFYESVYEMLDGESFNSSEELDAISATDYVIESGAVVLSVTDDLLIAAWNASRPAGGSVGLAATSTFFRNFKTKLAALATNAG